jgi:hypothetical protein
VQPLGGPSGRIASAEQAREDLGKLMGLKLLRSRSFLATRHFYFGEPGAGTGTPKLLHTLGVECPWRLRDQGLILVGSEDYGELAEGDTEPPCEPAARSGRLQDQKLAESLGELKGGDVFNTGSAFVVESLETDRYGGFTLGMSEGHFLDVVPCSRGQMEWILLFPGGGSLVLMNADLTRSKPKPEPPSEGM